MTTLPNSSTFTKINTENFIKISVNIFLILFLGFFFGFCKGLPDGIGYYFFLLFPLIAGSIQYRSLHVLFYAAFFFFGYHDLFQSLLNFNPSSTIWVKAVLPCTGWLLLFSIPPCLFFPKPQRKQLYFFFLYLSLFLSYLLPPIGVISSFPILSAIGYWFPGLKWWGFIFGTTLILLLAWSGRQRCQWQWSTSPFIILLLLISLIANYFYVLPTEPKDWHAVSSNRDILKQRFSIPTQQQYLADLALQALKTGYQHVVMSEATEGLWGKNTQDAWNPVIHYAQIHHQNLIFCMDKFFSKDQQIFVIEDQIKYYTNRQPMPWGAWLPGLGGNYFLGNYYSNAHWWNMGVVKINNQWVLLSKCFEDVVPWTNVYPFLHSPTPTLIIAMDSMWFATPSLKHKLHMDLEGWARLWNVPIVRADNLTDAEYKNFDTTLIKN